MLLLPGAERRDAACCPLGLRTLVAAADAPAATSPGANVATRTVAASPPAVRRLADSGGAVRGEGEGEGKEEAEWEEEGDEEEEEEGCWVSYGWRRRPRRLPPAMPSPRTLARERTAEGRLVISREEPAHRVCATKVDDRLVLELVDGGAAPAHRRRWSHPLAALEVSAAEAVEDSALDPAGEKNSAAAAGAAEDSTGNPEEEGVTGSLAVEPAVQPPPPTTSPVPDEACSEGAICAASLRVTRMSFARIVH